MMKSQIKINMIFNKTQTKRHKVNIYLYLCQNRTMINKMKTTIKTNEIKTDTFKAICFMDYYCHRYF